MVLLSTLWPTFYYYNGMRRVLIQVMDDRWESEVAEFGAINVTGFRLVDYSRKFARDFGEIWKKNGISVSVLQTKLINS